MVNMECITCLVLLLGLGGAMGSTLDARLTYSRKGERYLL